MKSNHFKINTVQWDGENKAEEVVLEHIDTGITTTLKSISLISKEREELAGKIEKMKKYENITTISHDKETKIKVLSQQSSSLLFTGFNQALDQVLSLIKNDNE